MRWHYDGGLELGHRSWAVDYDKEVRGDGGECSIKLPIVETAYHADGLDHVQASEEAEKSMMEGRSSVRQSSYLQCLCMIFRVE